MSWDRLLWGVEFTGSMKGDKPMLIGSRWMTPRQYRLRQLSPLMPEF